MKLPQLLELYETMLTARQIDLAEQQLSQRGEAFFHLSGAGHELTAVLNNHLTPDDWLHCHYRSRALLLARGIPVRKFFDGTLCKGTSGSQGRRMGPFFSDPKLKILSMVTPVGNNALQSVGVASAVKDRANSPIVVCGLGDGTTQQGEFLEAVAQAARDQIPVLFLIEDNGLAISTRTQGKTFYSGIAEGELFHGVPVRFVTGHNIIEAHEKLGRVVENMRVTRSPEIVVFQVQRLANHTNADDQNLYRSRAEIALAFESGDPLAICRDLLLVHGASESQLDALESEVERDVLAAEHAALDGVEPQAEHGAKLGIAAELTHPSREYRGRSDPTLTMRDAIRDVLRHHLQIDSRVCLFGEDIEDPKGDVFGVTRGLSTEFGERVKNSPLSESIIVGSSIGSSSRGAASGRHDSIRRFFAASVQPNRIRIGNDVLADRGEVECPRDHYGCLRWISPGAGTLPCTERRRHLRAPARHRRDDARHGSRCGGDVECRIRFRTSHAVPLSQGATERPAR